MSVEESFFDDLDRKFFWISSGMADIFAGTYGRLGYRLIAPIDPEKFDNATSTTKEVGIRALIVLGGIASFCFAGTYLLMSAVVLSVGSKMFKAAALYFQKDGFTHIRGNVAEEGLKNGEATIMTWNIRGHGGGLHYSEGGVVHWRSRVERIVDHIKNEQADVIVLQEVYDTALMEEIVDRLKASYAHFYTQIENGCMVIAKCGIHSFTQTRFDATDQKVRRGFETFEILAHPNDKTPCARIIGTQLSPGTRPKPLGWTKSPKL